MDLIIMIKPLLRNIWKLKQYAMQNHFPVMTLQAPKNLTFTGDNTKIKTQHETENKKTDKAKCPNPASFL